MLITPPAPPIESISDVPGLSTQLGLLAPLASPSFTGMPVVPDVPPLDATLRIATTKYVSERIAFLVAAAPNTLDTLFEISAALGNDPNFAQTIVAALGTKASKSANLSDLTDKVAARVALELVKGALAGNIPVIGADLGTSQVVLTNNMGALISQAMGTAFNKDFGQIAGTIAQGDDYRFGPAYSTDTFLMLPSQFETITTLTQTTNANEIYVIPVVVPFPIMVARLMFYVGTVASAVAAFSLWKMDRTTKVMDSGPVTISQNAMFQTIAPVNIRAGNYLMAWTANNASLKFSGSNNYMTGTIRTLMTLGTIVVGRAANPSVAGVFPATLGAITAMSTAAPLLILEGA